jgi:AcrR family transcriptional regulator
MRMLQAVRAAEERTGLVPEDELPRVLQLLWGRDQPRRGPKPGRTIADIAAAAVRIADSGGLEAVSMSAVAEAVGLTSMALYRYLDSKSDLYVAMTDAAYGRPPTQRPSGDWRAQLEAWASANYQALTAHPWIVAIPLSEPPLAPNPLRWMERGISAFADTGLSEQQKLSALLLVEVYVRGQVLLSSQLGPALAEEQLDEAEASTRYARRLALLIDKKGFPAVSAALLSGSLSDDGDFGAEEFAFGLRTVLDGISALVARAADELNLSGSSE